MNTQMPPGLYLMETGTGMIGIGDQAGNARQFGQKLQEGGRVQFREQHAGGGAAALIGAILELKSFLIAVETAMSAAIRKFRDNLPKYIGIEEIVDDDMRKRPFRRISIEKRLARRPALFRIEASVAANIREIEQCHSSLLNPVAATCAGKD
ncbi:hypothetical protein K7W03_00950 [Sphingobium sp. PNB]|uniref:hypothetical protein n=1 Tax=Sphingobium sp. PNB TaxID=863934 RepID=UPI001D029801|nr:hypothetical protein [Sphingobium sp. PNB]MCB4858153.1 hypothetical protein [Sphingobium sp. PNB]